jgi:DNA repair protein RecN (Recombination protein N)
METLDSFVEEKSAYVEYNNLYQELTTTEEALSGIIKLNQEKESKLDYIQFVCDEIERINPKENEETELEEKLEKIKELEKTISFFELSDDYIYGDNAVISKLEKIRKTLRGLSIEKELTEEIDSAIETVESLGVRISKIKKGYVKEVDVNSIQDRLSKIKSLIKKYGGSLSAVLTKKSEFKLQVERYNSIDDELNKIKKKKSEIIKKIESASKNLSEKRKIAAVLLGNSITNELQELNMRGSELLILISDLGYFNEKGKDKIEIFFRPNVGEKSLPLSEIASGGELSRVTLAIYRILGNFLNTNTFVFDEIDTGIGGETASIIGEKLKTLSEEKQVISVTHLPQIAEFADIHFIVKKNEVNKRTESSVNLLSKKEAKEEINRMRFGLNKK